MTISRADAKSLGPIENAILRALDRRRELVWHVRDDLDLGLPRQSLRMALTRLVAAGELERIERGTYVVMPRSGRRLVPPLRLVGSWFRSEPYAIVGHAAAEHHGLTLDTASAVEVLLTRQKAPSRYQGVRYVFSQRDHESVAQDNAIVGDAGIRAFVAKPAKVLVLLLDAAPKRRSLRATRDLRLAEEIIRRGANDHIWEAVDWPAIVRRHGTAAAARRLGFLLEHAGVRSADDLLPHRGESGNIPLSPLYPPTGPVDRRWRVVVNDPVVGP